MGIIRRKRDIAEKAETGVSEYRMGIISRAVYVY